MKKKLMSLMLCTMLVLLTGCSFNKNDATTAATTANTTNTVVDLEVFEIKSIEKKEYSYQVKEFDVGSGTYVAPSGKEMPYHINGIMGVPEGDGPFPLVLITHGSHSNDNEKLRFDTGFRYLVEELAKQGLVAVSMDMSKAYTWKYGDNDDREKSQYVTAEHIKTLQKANKGELKKYSVNLAGKIDFDKIALVGHSRGGETIFDIATEMQKNDMPVSALLSIAPTYMFDEREWPTAKVALVVPEYDGDVLNLDGIPIYDVLGTKMKEEHLAVLLKKANHNYFNSNIKVNDAKMQASSRDISDQLTREQQESFLKAFASDFFYTTLQEKSELISLNKGQPDKMYGEDITLLYKNAQSKVISSITDNSSYSVENLKAEVKTNAWFYKDDELLVDTLTYGEKEQRTRKLLKINWDTNPALLKATPSVTDWTGYQSLTLDLLVDPSDKLNEGTTYQHFTVRITDAKGNTSSMKLSKDMVALMVTPGAVDVTELSEEEKIYFWSVKTPLTSLLLPLSSFEGIDLSGVKLVELVCEDTPRGSLLLESIRVQ